MGGKHSRRYFAHRLRSPWDCHRRPKAITRATSAALISTAATQIHCCPSKFPPISGLGSVSGRPAFCVSAGHLCARLLRASSNCQRISVIDFGGSREGRRGITQCVRPAADDFLTGHAEILHQGLAFLKIHS